jgi:hypothetical protein
MARNGENAHAIRQDDVLALAGDPKTRPLKGPDCLEVVDAWQLGHGLDRDLDLPHLSPLRELGGNGEIFADSVADVIQGLLLSGAL